MSDDRFVITRRKGIDTAHHNPGERCNLDDTENDKEVSEDEALSMLQRGDARHCGHCWRQE